MTKYRQIRKKATISRFFNTEMTVSVVEPEEPSLRRCEPQVTALALYQTEEEGLQQAIHALKVSFTLLLTHITHAETFSESFAPRMAAQEESFSRVNELEERLQAQSKCRESELEERQEERKNAALDRIAAAREACEKCNSWADRQVSLPSGYDSINR